MDNFFPLVVASGLGGYEKSRIPLGVECCFGCAAAAYIGPAIFGCCALANQQESKGKNMKRLFISSVLLVLTGLAIAHSGGTDKNGCHTDRKTGVYHCH